MKIFTASQIRACDAYTIHAAAMPSIELMRRAAGACVGWITEHLQKDMPFVVLCGTGNNGGDGLAIAAMLHRQGYGVKAFLLQFSEQLSDDCAENLRQLQQMDSGLVEILQPGAFITDIPPHIIIIDAILGTGLSRPAEGWVADFIDHINHLPNRKVAVDIPSGLPADMVPASDAIVLKVQDTLSFQFYKRSFLHPESGVFAGNVHILDIGLNQDFIEGTHTFYHVASPQHIAGIYRPRSPFSHKGTFGSVLMVAGSHGKMGAATLATRAALRAGAGLVTALVPGTGYGVLQTAVPEAMCRTSGENVIEKIDGWEAAQAIGIGPGLGTDAKSAAALAKLIDECAQPMLIDADALNLIAKQPELLTKLPKGSVITPHPKEYARLFGDFANSMAQVDNARMQAMRHGINIVLKGHHTAVINTEGACWYNNTGNAGMATGGTGDVLSGIITGLLAQHYAPHDAALLGVYLHGLAGDLAAAELSEEALVAGDIIDYLGKAFMKIRKGMQP